MKYPVEAIGVSLILAIPVVAFTSYFCEKKFKLEFLQLKHNEQMHSDIRKVLENLPEGILLFKQATREVILGNAELRKLFNCDQQNDNMQLS